MYKKTKKLLAWCLVVSMILTQMIFTNVAFAAASSSRLSGADRYETALRISQNGWTAGSTEYAVLAYGEDFPDALSAAPLAKKYNAPILLTAKDSLSAGVLDEINRVGAKTVFVVGGEGVVSKTVADALTAAGKTVERLAGASRYETALKVAEKVGTTDAVVVAYGENYPDALSIAPIAAAKGWPILLTDANSMDDAVKAYIGSKKAYVVGGSGVVSDAVYNGLSNAERVFGSDRYATNVAVMNKFAADLNFGKVFLATGEAFADALAGSVLAAKTASPMVLVGATMDPATESFVNGKVSEGTVVVALGGSAVVSDAAVGAVGGTTAVLSITGVSTLTQDGRGIRISFNKSVADLSSADITIVNKDSGDAVGVESVSMSSNKMTADVWFLEESEDTTGDGYVKQGETYTITVAAGASTLSYEYQRPWYLDEVRVVDYDADERELDLDNGMTLTVPEDMTLDYEYVLGRQLNVWTDEDNFITRYTVNDDTKEETVKYDAVTVNDDKTITLENEDKDYDLATSAEIFVDRNDTYKVKANASNDETGDTYSAYGLDKIDGTTYDYGKVVVDKNGDVVFADVFDMEDFIVVEGVEDETVTAYGDELDAEDFVLVKDGKTIALDDLEAGDLLYFTTAARDDDGYAVVYNNTVEGKLEDITDNNFTVNDEEYDFNIGEKYDKPVQYLDGDELSDLLADDADDMQDTDEDVAVYLDWQGDAVYVSGNTGDSATSSVVGFLYNNMTAYTENGRDDVYIAIDMINENGEDVSYDVKEDDLDDYNFNIPTGTDKTILPAGNLVRVRLDADGDVKELYIPDDDTNTNLVTDYSYDDEDDIMTSVPFTDGTTVETDDSYAMGSKLDEDTVIFQVEDYYGAVDPDKDDIDVVKLGDAENFTEINDKVSKPAGGSVYSQVYSNSDNEAKYIVAAMTDSDDDSTEYAALIYDIEKIKGDDVYRVKAWVDGEDKSLKTRDTNSVFTYFDGVGTADGEYDIIKDALDDTGNGYFACKLLLDDETGEIVNKGTPKAISAEAAGDELIPLTAVTTNTLSEFVVNSKSTSNDKITVYVDSNVVNPNGDPAGSETYTYKLSSDYQVFDATDVTDIDSEKLQTVDKSYKVVMFYDTTGTEANTRFVKFVLITHDDEY